MGEGWEDEQKVLTRGYDTLSWGHLKHLNLMLLLSNTDENQNQPEDDFFFSEWDVTDSILNLT